MDSNRPPTLRNKKIIISKLQIDLELKTREKQNENGQEVGRFCDCNQGKDYLHNEKSNQNKQIKMIFVVVV